MARASREVVATTSLVLALMKICGQTQHSCVASQGLQTAQGLDAGAADSLLR